MKKNIFQSKNSFALLYAIIFIFLFLLTITFITTLTLSAIRNTRRAISATGAYQVAQAGIEDGIYQIQNHPAKLDTYRYYIKDGSQQYPFIGLDTTTSTDSGYYEITFISTTAVTIIGYYPWMNSTLDVILTATKCPVAASCVNGWTVQQIGG